MRFENELQGQLLSDWTANIIGVLHGVKRWITAFLLKYLSFRGGSSVDTDALVMVERFRWKVIWQTSKQKSGRYPSALADTVLNFPQRCCLSNRRLILLGESPTQEEHRSVGEHANILTPESETIHQ